MEQMTIEGSGEPNAQDDYSVKQKISALELDVVYGDKAGRQKKNKSYKNLFPTVASLPISLTEIL